MTLRSKTFSDPTSHHNLTCIVRVQCCMGARSLRKIATAAAWVGALTACSSGGAPRRTVVVADVPDATAFVTDRFGNLWVSQPAEGQISLFEMKDGKAARQTVIFDNLNEPFGLALAPGEPLRLYFGERGGVSHVDLYTEDRPERIFHAPKDLSTRSLLFGAGGRLYVAMASTRDPCDVCGAVYSMSPGGEDIERVIRSSARIEFLAQRYVDGSIWAAFDNPDPTKPDHLQAIEDGGERVDLGAGGSPGGLAFVPEEGWPQELWYDALLGYYGPRGGRVARVRFEAKNHARSAEQFMDGFYRPGGISATPGGILRVADRKNGQIYQITPRAHQ